MVEHPIQLLLELVVADQVVFVLVEVLEGVHDFLLVEAREGQHLADHVVEPHYCHVAVLEFPAGLVPIEEPLVVQP